MFKISSYNRVNGTDWKVTPKPTNNGQNASLTLEKNGKTIEFSRKKRLIINLIGTSGSGKSIHGERLSREYGIPHISLGDIYRHALQNQSELGSIMVYQAKINAVYSVNELCLGLLAKRLSESDCSNGAILDGFPRTYIQGIVLNKTFLNDTDVHIPIFLDVEDDIVIERLTKRLYCQPCLRQFRSDDILKNNVCPTCNITLTKREDDGDKKKLSEKLRVFKEYREGILQSIQLRDRINVIHMERNTTITDVYERISKIVNEKLNDQIQQNPHLLIKMLSKLPCGAYI